MRFLLLVTVFSCNLFLARAQVASDCQLPTGSLGLCTPISNCVHVIDLLKNLNTETPIPSDVKLLIRESFFCPKKGLGVEVCCPADGLKTTVQVTGSERGSCVMQDNLPAECVGYDKCAPFVQMMANLRRPLPSSTPKLIRSSYLCGKDLEANIPKVCCPSAALKPNRPAKEEQEEREVTSTTPETTTVDRFAEHAGRSLLASSDSCGLPLAGVRIVGGQDASLGQYPWLVNLGYTLNNRPKPLFKCGGTLIGRSHVLTAAHCVIQLPRGFDLNVVRVGEHDLSQGVDCEDEFCAPPPQEFQVAKVIPHQSYGKPASFQNDIAIIKLDGAVQINDYVTPICLPYNHHNDNYLSNRISLDDGEEFLTNTEVAGWGATNKIGRDPADVLQYLSVNVTNLQACTDVYTQRGGVLTDKQICAGGEEGKDSCVGDSGSALMRNYPGKTIDQWSIIGVVSFGPKLCGTKGVPGVYTRVNSYIDWILDTVAGS